MTTAKKPKAHPKKAAPAAPKADTLSIHHKEGKSDERLMAESTLSAAMGNAITARRFARGTWGESDLTETVVAMREKAEKVQAGDLSDMEEMLTAQATALDSIFTEMARRAALNMGEYINAADTYMRLALKAQSQCRTTIEALAEIKNPRPVAFVRQANISHGPQQVNNGVQAGDAPAHGNNPIQSNELSGGSLELLPDTRASQAQSRVNPSVEAVAEIYRATD